MSYYHISVKGFVLHNDKYLFVKKANNGSRNEGYWELPGGGLNFGELPETALRREIKEETGLNIQVIRPLLTWSFIKNKNKQVIGITYLCESKENSVTISDEHDNYTWISKNNFSNITMLPELKKDIEKWMGSL